MYDPTIGRWISQDPLGFDAGDSNLYRYAHNDPVSTTDATGLWATNDHLVMQKGFLDQWFPKYPKMTEMAKNAVTDILREANASQDALLSFAYSDKKRHYTRDYVADELDVESSVIQALRKQRGIDAQAQYDYYITQETDFTRTGNKIGKKLQALGRLVHSFQDFFGHSVRTDLGGRLRTNPPTGPRANRCGSQNSRWPGFTAFSEGASGTPFAPNGLMPSSFRGPLEAEHPGIGEPILLGPEYKSRWNAAVAFIYPVFDKYLTEIYNASAGFSMSVEWF